MDELTSPTGDAQAIIEAVRVDAAARRVEIEQQSGEGALLVDLPTGRKIEDLTPILDKHRYRPRFRRGVSAHESLDSLIAHARRFRDDGSAAFVSPGKGKVVVVLDHDGAGGAEDNTQRRRAHRATWTPPYHEDWTRWTDSGRHGEWLDPVSFAEHLEDGAGELLPRPDLNAEADAKLIDLAAKMRLRFGDPDQIVGLARDFKIHVDSEVQAVHTLQSGEAAITFREGHNDGTGEKIQVPGAFVIGMHVFDGDPAVYRAMVKLRYRKFGGAVKWRYEIHNLADIKRAAWTGVADQLRAGVEAAEATETDVKTGEVSALPARPFPVFIGQPEDPA